MRVTLTPDMLRKAKPGATRTFLWDSVVPGLGLIVQPSGKKSWIFQGSATDGRRKTIQAVSLADARKAAFALKAGLNLGPVEFEPEAQLVSGPLTPRQRYRR